MRARRWIGMMLLALCASASAGDARAASECEKIQSPFAYNECLARQAPPRAQRAPRAGGDPEASVRRRGPSASAEAPQNGVRISRRSGRRVSATIDPWAGARTPSTSPRKRRR